MHLRLVCARECGFTLYIIEDMKGQGGEGEGLCEATACSVL